jgi:ADP-heptose:LPS heptosyltransferase
LLIGGPEDHKNAEEIIQNCSGIIFNACGKYNINQSASLIRQAEKVITHDTGLMHIAAAFKKDIVSVWGNTIPQFGMRPYLPLGQGSSKIIETVDLGCRPCSKLGFEKCPKKHFNCMNLIDNQEIINAAT